MESRKRLFFTVTGKPGSGKTSWLVKNIVNQYKHGNVFFYKDYSSAEDPATMHLPIIDLKNYKATPGKYVKCRVIGVGYKQYIQFLDRIIKDAESNQPNAINNGLLIIDDATILERNVLSEQMERILTMRRHKGYRLDVILVFHGFSRQPIHLFSFIDKAIVFNTADNPAYKQSRLPLDNLEAAIKKARANAQSNDARLRYTPAVADFT